MTVQTKPHGSLPDEEVDKPRGGPALLRPLAVRDFRVVWTGETVSLLGDQFYFVALAWLTLQITGSGLALGTVLTVGAVPRAALMLLGGAVTDRFSPRMLMLQSNTFRAIVVAGLATIVLLGHAELWELYVIALLFGAIDAVFYPASEMVAPLLLDDDRLTAGNALTQGSFQFMGLIGPAAAGVVIVVAGRTVGNGAAFGFDAASFAIAAIMLFLSKPSSWNRKTRQESGDDDKNLLRSLVDGLAYVWRDPVIRTLLITIALVDTGAAGTLSVGLPALAHARFSLGAAGYGIVLSGFSLGALAGTIAGGSMPHIRRRGWLSIVMLAYIGVGIVALGFAQTVLIATIIAAVTGIGTGLINVVMLPWLQTRTDAAMLGRVMSMVMFASLGLSPLAYLAAGVLVNVSITLVFVLGGGLMLAGAVYASASSSVRTID